MTRPLKYDDSFINILTHKIHDKFLYCIPLKVQSTAFFRKYSLLQALLLIGIFDLIVGLVYMYLFAKIITITHDFFVIFEIVIFRLFCIYFRKLPGVFDMGQILEILRLIQIILRHI